MVYNAAAEQRIYDLIEKSSQGSLSEGNVVLEQALRVLNQEFGASHYLDLPEHDVERLRVRKNFYGLIIGAYDKLINNFIKSNSENIGEEKKGLEKKVEDLEVTVEELTDENNQLENAQQAFKTI